MSPDPNGLAATQAVKKGLAMAKLGAKEVEYINAHGTSTIINDPTESFIIKRVYGDYAYKIPISSSKSYFGHTLGAAGGLESIIYHVVYTQIFEHQGYMGCSGLPVIECSK